MRALVLAALVLTGCVVKVEDSRVTREELTQAFSQRDENIKLLAMKLNELAKKEKE